MICLAEYTRQGSVWLGEFKILREYSFEDAMTMKLNVPLSAIKSWDKLQN